MHGGDGGGKLYFLLLKSIKRKKAQFWAKCLNSFCRRLQICPFLLLVGRAALVAAKISSSERVAMFGKALNSNLESGEDFILIETTMPFICKSIIFIFKHVRSLLKLQLASLPLKARILGRITLFLGEQKGGSVWNH